MDQLRRLAHFLTLALALVLGVEQAHAAIGFSMADSAFVGNARRAAAGGACATTDTSLAHDEMLEGWEGDGTELTWTTGETANSCTITTGFDSSALTTGKVAGMCDKALQVVLAAGTAGDKYIYFTVASPVAAGVAANFNVYLYVTTLPDDGENFAIANFGEGTDPSGQSCGLLYLQNDSGTAKVQMSSAGSSSWISLTANSWNLITVHIDATAANCTLAVNGGAPSSWERTARGISYVHVGCPGGKGTDDSGTFVLDVGALNTP